MMSSDERTRARLEFLEWEANTHPRRHAMRLTALVMLGYAFPLSLLTLSFGISVLLFWLGPAAWQQDTGIFFWWCVGFILSLLIVAAVLGTFRVHLPEPAGHPLRLGEAAQLRAMVDDVCAAAGGSVSIHQIHIDFSFNAAASQRRKYGLFGTATNYLLLGLPMLIALTPQQLKSVIAHEIGHFHGQHNSFGAWIGRVYQTWQSLAGPITAKRWRRALVGWFVRWYGPHVQTTTLALRRVHEYAADRSAADYSGLRQTAEALLEIDRTGYRLDRSFWPQVLRGACRGEPIPPGDVFPRMQAFLQSDVPQDMMQRWKARELAARTPVTADHPCLKDRLTRLGFAHLLEQAPLCFQPQPCGACLELLGECREHVWAVCSASWKAMSIERWRTEYAIVKHLKESAEKTSQAQSEIPLDPQKRGQREWDLLEPQVHAASPAEAIAALREFVARHPTVAGAHYALGQMLLRQDDELAADSLERAMQYGSEFIAPSLNMLLDYYRDAGRDAEADPIRRRLIEHERLSKVAHKERQRVTRRDRFMEHGVSTDELQKVRTVLHRHPQITAAFLVRKQVKLFTDKPSYVLAVRRRARAMEDQRRIDKALIASLSSQVPIPCTVVILGWTSPRLQSRIAAACPQPVFVCSD
jgi:Zn-dependent protease with chaperone function